MATTLQPSTGLCPPAAGASSPGRWGAKKFPEHQNPAAGEAKLAAFSTGEARERAKVSRTRHVAGGWAVLWGSAGSHRARACSPPSEGAERARGLAPRPLLRAFGSSPCFSQCKRKSPNPKDTAAYNLLAAGRLLGNCDGGPSRIVNAFPSARRGRSSDFLRDTASCDHPLFLAGMGRRAGVPTLPHGPDVETCCCL